MDLEENLEWMNHGLFYETIANRYFFCRDHGAKQSYRYKLASVSCMVHDTHNILITMC